MSLDKKLQELRQKSKMSIAACAESIGVSQSTYREWENGRSISGEPYVKIANLFGVSLSELFGVKDQDVTHELGLIEEELQRMVSHIKSLRSSL